MIVADTNLISYLVVPGSFTAAAEQVLRKDPFWNAPILWRSELRNVLAKHIRGGHVTLPAALNAMLRAETLFAGREHAVDSPSVLSLAAASGCTAYDCEFVALAQAEGWPLVTSDKQVLKAFPAVAISPDDFVR